MTKSKLLPLAFCLLALLTRPASAQASKPSASDTPPDYGIDLAASYQGTEVQALLEAAENEASKAISEAYAEGYKAGLLETAPDRDYWKSLSESTAAEAKAQRRDALVLGATAGGATVAILSLVVFCWVR
jgi:hypothetical protein